MFGIRPFVRIAVFTHRLKMNIFFFFLGGGGGGKAQKKNSFNKNGVIDVRYVRAKLITSCEARLHFYYERKIFHFKTSFFFFNPKSNLLVLLQRLFLDVGMAPWNMANTILKI